MASDKSQQAACGRVVEILQRARMQRGLSMTQVAERAGLSQQMVSYVERRMRNPTLETLLRIAAAIEIDFGDVMRQALKRPPQCLPRSRPRPFARAAAPTRVRGRAGSH